MKINQGNFTTADLQGAPETFNNPDPISDFQTGITLTQPIYSRRAILGVKMARDEAGAVSLDRERRARGGRAPGAAGLARRAGRGSLPRDGAARRGGRGGAPAPGQRRRERRHRARLRPAARRGRPGRGASDAPDGRKRPRDRPARPRAGRRAGGGAGPGRGGPVVAAPDLETLLAGAGSRADLRALAARVVERPPRRQARGRRATPRGRTHRLAAGERPGRPVRHRGHQLHGRRRRDLAALRRISHSGGRGAG